MIKQLICIFLTINYTILKCSRGCGRCEIGKDTCIYCHINEGFLLENGKCIELRYPNCLKYDVKGDCIQCEQDYYPNQRQCEKVQENQKIEKCLIYKSSNQCQRCDKHHYFTDGKCQPVPQIYMGCLEYSADDYNFCEVCEEQYIRPRDKRGCLERPKIENCNTFYSLNCKQCENNYLLNENYYFFNVLDINSSELKQKQINEFLHNGTQMPLRFCQSFNISNCKKVDYLKKDYCEICDDNYYLKEGKCYKYPREGIYQCKMYESFTKCLECNQGFYLKSETECAAITQKILNCKNYQTNTNEIVCIECDSDYKINDLNECVERQTKSIDSCLNMDIKEEKCQQCDETFQVTSDGKKCLNSIPNCIKYVNSTGDTTELSCQQCNDGEFYNTLEKKCQEGNILNCKIYTDALCTECAFGYFLSENTCQKNINIPNCKVYSDSKFGRCSECEFNYYLFDKVNSCKPATQIENCSTYNNEKTCSKCNLGYQLIDQLNETTGTTNICQKSNQDTNCAEFNGSLCIKCDVGFIKEGTNCVQKIDYIENFCETSNNNGQITIDQFVCEKCKPNSYPLNLSESYICTHNDNVEIKLPNCVKQFYDSVNDGYLCQKCEDGYYIKDNECVSQCADTEIIAIQSIEKNRKDLNSIEYDSIKLGFSNFCTSDTLQIKDCTKIAVDLFTQQNNYQMIDYVCVECAPNNFMVPVAQKTSNIKPGDNQSPLSYGTFIFPGIECLNPSEVILRNNDDSNTLIENCEYYYNVMKVKQQKNYGCLKCKFGYTGVPPKSTSVDENSSITECLAINDDKQSHGKDGDCDLNVFYSGYTQNINQLNINVLPLESYITCHKCINHNNVVHKPFLFLTFEDFDRYITGQGYIHDNSTGSKISKPVSIDNYNIKYDNYSGLGKVQRCLSLEKNNFLNDFNYTFQQMAEDINSPFDCSMFMVNILRYTYAMESFATSVLARNIIFCVACNPGFKPTYYENGQSPQLIDYYVPYQVSKCNQILNCKQGGNWVNACQECNDNYYFEWKTEEKMIDYTKCILGPNQNIHNPKRFINTLEDKYKINLQFCLAVDNEKCVICQKGYEMKKYTNASGNEEFYGDYCDKIRISFCQDDYNVFQNFYPVNPENINLAMNYLGMRRENNGCNKCLEGYISLYKESSAQTALNLICSLSDVVIGSQIEYFNRVLTPNCLNYGYDDKIQCKQCDIGRGLFKRVVTDNDYKKQKYDCLTNLPIENCMIYYNDVNGNNICEQCFPNYIKLNNSCQQGQIDKCKIYDQSTDLNFQKCITCNDGYFTENGSKCELGELQGCLQFTSKNECASCVAGEQLIILKNEVNKCLEIDDVLKCQQISPEEFKVKSINCIQCIQDYYKDPSPGETISFCLKLPEILNCKKYDKQTLPTDSTLLCLECENEYYLDNVTQKCVKRTLFDLNCSQYKLDKDECLSCKEGYFIFEKKQCIKNPNGILNCQKYSNETVCAVCKKDYYLVNDQCVKVDQDKIKANCLEYDAQQFCQVCENTHFLNIDQCDLTEAQNCLEVENQFNCKSCPEGYGLLKSVEGSNCQKYTDPNCVSYNQQDPFVCEECKKGYFFNQEKICVEQSDFLIDNCLIYENNEKCIICKQGFVLSIDQKLCSNEDYYKVYMDEHCTNNVVLEDPVCAACAQGYYFKDSVCTKCTEQTLDQGCSFCNPSNQSECLLCKPNYFMDNEGTCKENSSVENQETNTVIETSKFINILMGLFLVMVQVY